MPTPFAYTARDGKVTWRVRVRVNGKQSSEAFSSKAKADAFAARCVRVGPERAVADRNRIDEDHADYVPTLGEWFDHYIEHATGISVRTRQDYTRLAHRKMLPMLGALRLDEIDRDTVARFVNALEREPRLGNRGRVKGKPIGGTLSAKTISTHHGLLSALMKTAVTEGHITANPCLGVRLPRSGEHERVEARFMTHEEWNALEDLLRPGMPRTLGITLIHSGMRWSEATALQVRHVDLARGIIHVRQAWKKTGGRRELGPPKTQKSRRDVIIAPGLAELLAELIEDQPQDAFVFRTRSGRPPFPGSFASRHWNPAARAAGIVPKPRVHDARHTHASWLLEAGATLEQVQDQLGHESILTTRKVYGSLQPAMRESLRAAATLAMRGGPAQIGR